MAAPTNYYVDPDAGVDAAGNGADTAPYASVQYCIDDITTSHGGRDAADGDQINVVEGTDDTPAAVIDLATVGAVYGVPTFDAPLIIRGCSRDPITGLPVANNGGVGGMDGGAGGFSIFDGVNHVPVIDYVHFIDMHCHNTAAAEVLYFRDYSSCINCELDTCTLRGIRAGSYGAYSGNNIHDVATGLELVAANQISGNYIQDVTAYCIWLAGSYNDVTRNILIPSAVGAEAIVVSAQCQHIVGNSILADSVATTAAILFDAVTHYGVTIADNLIEGFSGVLGAAFDFFNSTRHIQLFANNSYYDCTLTPILRDCDKNFDAGNEALTASPFAKTGAMTYANRYAYFAPVIAVRGRAWPDGCQFDRGAVQVRLVTEETVPAFSPITIPARTIYHPL